MKTKEIKKLTEDELNNKINSLKKDLFNFRFRKANGQLEDTAKVSTLKRDIAKLYLEYVSRLEWAKYNPLAELYFEFSSRKEAH